MGDIKKLYKYLQSRKVQGLGSEDEFKDGFLNDSAFSQRVYDYVKPMFSDIEDTHKAFVDGFREPKNNTAYATPVPYEKKKYYGIGEDYPDWVDKQKQYFGNPPKDIDEAAVGIKKANNMELTPQEKSRERRAKATEHVNANIGVERYNAYKEAEAQYRAAITSRLDVDIERAKADKRAKEEEINKTIPQGSRALALFPQAKMAVQWTIPAYTLDVLEDTKELLEAPTKGSNWAGSMWAGFRDNADIKSFLSLGMSIFAKTGKVYDICSRYTNGEKLTDEETNLLEALAMNTAVAGLRAGDISGWYRSGEVTGDMVEIMGQFLLTGGIGTGASKVVSKAIGKTMQKILPKVVSKMGAKGAVGTVLRGAKFAGKGAVDVVAGGAAQSIYMPSTYSGYWEKKSGTVTHGDKDGEYNIEPSKINDLQAMLSSMAETGTERLGGAFVGTGSKILKNIVPKSWAKLSTKGAIGALIKAGGTANKYMAKAGVNSTMGELSEEFAGAAFDKAIGASSDEEWKAFWSKDNMLQMIGGFAPMSMFGLGMNGATIANKRLSALRSKRKFVAFTREAGSKEGVKMAEDILNAPIEDLGNKMHKYTQEIGGYTDGELNDKGVEFNYFAAEMLRRSTERNIADEWDSDIRQEAEDNVNTGDKRTIDDTIDDTVDDRVDDTEQTIPQVQQGDEVEYDNARWIVGSVAEEDGEYTFGDESIPLKKGNVLMFEADGNGMQILESTADLYAEDKDNGIESRRQEIYEKYRPVMNVDTGNVIQLSSTADNDNIAYVVKGRVVYDEEGNIDYDKSDDTIYYKVYDKEGNEVDGGTPRPLHLKTHRTEFGKVLSDTPIEEYVDNELYPQDETEQSSATGSVSTDERQEVTDENGLPFVKTSNGVTDFGYIPEDTGLTPAPIRLSIGDERTGLQHIVDRHGEQIAKAGFDNVVDFVEYVASNYDTITEGVDTSGEPNGTYLLQAKDKHNNTLYVELSNDGSYWNINSGGVFRKGYGEKNKVVWSASEVQRRLKSATPDTLRSQDEADNQGDPNRTVSDTTSTDKGTTNNLNRQNTVLDSEEADLLMSAMEQNAETMQNLELNYDNWLSEFGRDGIVNTPIGDVKMGDNQFLKMSSKERQWQFGMVRPTLTNPDIIIEEPSEARAGQATERGSSYLFVKTFDVNGEKIRHFESITVKKDGLEVSVSSHIIKPAQLKSRLLNGSILWSKPQIANSIVSGEQQTLDDSRIQDPNANNHGSEVRVSTDSKGITKNRNTQNTVLNNKPELTSIGSDVYLTETHEGQSDLVPTQKANSDLQYKGTTNKPDIQEEFYNSLPRNKKGEIDENLMSAEQKIRYAQAEFGEDEELVKEYISEQSKALSDKIAKLANKSGKSVAEFKELAALKRDKITFVEYLNEQRQQAAPSRAGRRGSESELGVGEQSEAGTAAADDRGRTEADIAEAVKDIDVEPTEAQKKAGNYKKGHVKIQGFDITIENPKGAIRKGVDYNGKAWSTEMRNHYGYFKNTEGKDGDHIDVFIGDNPNSKRIFVVDQINPKTKEFDESKVMLGFDTEDEAKKAYLSNYSKDWKGFKDITYVDIDTFRDWLYDGAKQRKPFGEYSNIRFRSIKDINDRFNEELQQQIDGTLPKGHVYSLGMPNDILRSAGLPNLPIEMSAERLAGKSQQANHPFELSETESLPAAIQHPIAIFDSTKKDGSSVILTELKHGDSNFIAVLGVRRSDKQRKIDVEVNSIRSLYPKTHIRGIIDWFNSKDNLLRWADKEKALNFISTQEPNYLAGGDNAQSTSSESNLSSSKPAEVRNIFKRVAKVIKDFENPTLSEEKNEETRLKASKRKARGATTEKLEELVTLLKKTGFADVKTGEDFYNALAEIGGSERYSSQSEKKLYNPRGFITPVRGEWTKEKIKKRLKESGGSLVGYDRAAKLISEFDSPDELAENIFYHGTVYGSGRLKPSILMSDMDVERYGGGGYGDKYWGISVSRNKKIASNFSGTSAGVSILPIVLAKGAKIKEMPDLKDSADIDDVIVDLWKEGVDAVWVGDKNKGEQELCVINPRAIVNINRADTYRVYGLGGEENPINIINKEGIKKLYEDAKQYWEQKKIAPKGPLKPFRFYFDEHNHIGDKKPDDVYDREMKAYEEQLRVYESSDEYKKWQKAQEYARDNIRFMIGKQVDDISIVDGEDEDIRYRRPNGTVLGFVKGNTIYLNPDEVSLNTPIHEFGHLWVSQVKGHFPELWAKGKELFLESDYLRKVQADPNYQHLDLDGQIDEAMARAIGDRGEQELDKTLLEKILDWIAEVWEKIGGVFGIDNLTSEQISNLTLQDFTDMATSELLSGQNLTERVKGERGGATRYNTADETADIKARSIADGTFMKAPNGKDTNLTERQWLQVRTKAFKKWFGDWEKTARIEKLKKTKPIEITGEEVKPSDDLKEYKKNALEYGKTLQGEYTNKDTGITIQLQRGRKNGGLNEVLQHDYKDREHLQSIAAIPQIIENATYIDSEPNNDIPKNPDVKEYQYYVCGLKIGGEDYTVRAVVAVDNKGDRYYDHKLTNIEKGKLLDQINSQAIKNNGFGTTPGTKPTTVVSEYKDSKLISLLQENSSKVVDENGEPMVVYHGTNKFGFTVFDKEFSDDKTSIFFTDRVDIAKGYAGVNADVRSLYDDDTTGGYSKDEMLSMLFADVDISSHTNGWDVANDILPYITEDIGITAEYDDEDGVLTLSSDYTGDTYRLTDEEFSWEKVENWLRDNADLENVIDKNAGIYGVFVNARNVLDIDAGGSMWSYIPKKKVKGAEGVGNMNTRDIVEHAKKLNYDGVYIKDLLDTGGRGYGLVGDIEGDIFISLVDKNQIKSATDNIGTFDGEDEDIRYSVGNADYFVNERFNEQLEHLTESNADSTMFRLGYPDMILQSTGIPNKELRLYGNKLLKKAEKHDFNVKDLVDLPTSIQTPMFVFKGNHPDSFSIVTELKIRDKNVLVSIERNKDGEVDFNLISSVYGKSGRGIVHWLNNGKALYVNKEKALDYLRISAPIAEAQDKGELNPSVSTEKALAWQAALAPIASATLKQELITATKIIENFENPPINEKKVIDDTTNDMVRYSIKASEQLDKEDEIMGKKAAEIYEARVKMGKQMNQSDPKKMPNKKIFDEINRKTENIRAKTAEHAADCYLPMKHLIEIFNKHGYNIADYNNWYMNVFALAGKNEAEYEKYQAERSVPLQRAAKAAMDSGNISYRELENYLILKHGQERNKYYKERDEKLGVKPMKDYSGTEAVMFEEFCKRTGIEVKTIEEDIPKLVDGDPNMIRYDNGKSEFSKDGKKIPDFEINKRFELWRKQHTPEEIIKDYEEKIGKEKVEDLWSKIRKATQFTLDCQKEGGLTSEKMYEKASGMWEYFVPLRGFDMGTAQDEYDYDLNGITLFTDFRVEQTLGRTRRSVSPLAWTEQMAHITIQQKNKNLLNQSLRRLASVSTARKDNIMFLSKQYKEPDVIENGKVVREGALINPPAHTGNPTEDIAAFERWEASMKEGVKNGTIEVVEHSNVNFGMIVSADKVKQHVVRVYEGGRPVDIIFNTSPSVPRAINGLNNKTVVLNDWFFRQVKAGTRLMAQTMTTYNPAFVGKNFMRDYLFANTMLMGKEDRTYRANFNKNIVKAHSVMFDYVKGKSLLGWAAGDKGSVRDNEYSRWLTEFVMNGGKTGFSQMFKFEKMSSDFKKQTEKGDKKVHYGVNDYIHFIEAMNDYAENITRFSAYCASRQAGRSIERSISDAKELTINFNRKGIDGGAWGEIRSLCAFSNASIQALVVFSRGVRANPKRMGAIISSYVAMPIAMAIVASLVGGDDYFKLSKYDRQNNICIPMFGGGFIKIPLPQELRVFWKLGDEIALCIYRNEPPEVAAQEVFMGALDLLPSFAAGATSISDVLDEKIGAGELLLAHQPITIIQPATQLMTNRNFLNYRIYDDNKWGGRRKELPEYRKALRNRGGETYSPNFVVKLSEGIGRLTGGSDLKRGAVEVNPDVINHLMRGYFGGLYSSAVAAINMGDKGAQSIAAGEMKMKTTDSPTMKAFYVSPSNLRYTDDILNARYMDVLKEAKKHADVYANYLKEGEVDRFEEETKMTEDEALDWRYLVKGIDKEVQELRNEIATAETTKERDEALRQLEALQREAIDMAVKLKK